MVASLDIRHLRPLLNLTGDRLHALPLLVLYLTDGCNSRCLTCDIWKRPRRNMSLELVDQLAREGQALGLRRVILSGGEAMQHTDWPRIANAFRHIGAKVELLTNGLLLKRQTQTVIDHVDQLIVSLDGGTAETYHHIRGVDGFDSILTGISECAAAGLPVMTRTTVQRDNFRELPQIIDAARRAGVQKVSFLAVDVSSIEAFGPRFTDDHQPPSSALSVADLPDLAAVLDRLERDYAPDFASGLIAENPKKMRRLYDYFAAINGLGSSPAPRCNAPHISAVVEVDGRIRPCFFLPTVGKVAADQPLVETLNHVEAVAMRQAYRSGQRPECAHCVCSLYQGPRTLLRNERAATL